MASVAKGNHASENSFPLRQQLPRTDGALRAEAGSQRKAKSETNELGKGTEKCRKKNPKREILCQKFKDVRERERAGCEEKGVKTREDPNHVA